MQMMASNPTRLPDGRIDRLDHAEPARIWKARCFIHEHLGEELSLARVADFVTISPNYLSEEFKRVTGSKFVDYIARTRVEKACELLIISNLRISEIAFGVGFQSLSQFNRSFKKLSGKSPTEHRAAGTGPRQALPAPNLLQCIH
jgi:AraC-like DNA-binding protein